MQGMGCQKGPLGWVEGPGVCCYGPDPSQLSSYQTEASRDQGLAPGCGGSVGHRQGGLSWWWGC